MSKCGMWLVGASSLGLAAAPGAGDTIRHFVDGPYSDVPALLDLVGIGSANTGSETVATSFLVPGASGTTTDLTFTTQRDTGSFNYNFGFFSTSAVAGIDPIASRQAWATAALAAATQVFDDLTTPTPPPTTSITFAVDAGTELVFYLIPNNTLASFNADPSSFYADSSGLGGGNSVLRSPLFSVSDANPGEYDQMLSFIANGVTLFTFEDLVRTGPSDQDFTDLAFTIDVALTPVIPLPSAAAMGVVGLIAIGGRGRRFTS